MGKGDKITFKRANKFVHIITFLGIMLFIIPASINQSYTPIVLILMGINLLNTSLVAFNRKKIPLFILLAVLPLLVYLGITLTK